MLDDHIWAARLPATPDAPVLSATCAVLVGKAFENQRQPIAVEGFMEPIGVDALARRLFQIARRPAVGPREVWSWPGEIDPILVVAVDARDMTSVLLGRELCSAFSHALLVTVLLLAHPAVLSSDGSLRRISNQGVPLDLAFGQTWCTLEMTSADPYSDAVRIADAITLRNPGFIGVDFGDVQRALAPGTIGATASASADGDERAERATREAIRKLASIRADWSQASGLIIRVTSGRDFKMAETKVMLEILRESLNSDVNIVFSWTYRDEKHVGQDGSIEVDIVVSFDAC